MLTSISGFRRYMLVLFTTVLVSTAISGARSNADDKAAMRAIVEHWSPTSGITQNFLYQLENTDDHRRIAVVIKRPDDNRSKDVFIRFIIEPRETKMIGFYRFNGEAVVQSAKLE